MSRQAWSSRIDALNDDKTKPLLIEAIEHSVITYLETLKRRWKDENEQKF